AAPRAGTPPRALAAHADSRYADAVLVREDAEPRGQLALGPHSKLALELHRKCLARRCPIGFDALPLGLDPRALPLDELARFAFRPAPRYRHARRSVVADAHDIAPCTEMAHEDRLDVWSCRDVIHCEKLLVACIA